MRGKGMRYFGIRRAAALLLCLTLLTGFAGCGGTSDGTEPPAAETVGIIPGLAERLEGYRVVRADAGSAQEAKTAAAVRAAVTAHTGVEPDIMTDFLGRKDTLPTDAHEILVGATNRPISKAVMEELIGVRANNRADFAVRIGGGNIALCGGSPEAIAEAAAWFEDLLLAGPLPDEYEYVYRKEYREITVGGENIGNFTVVLPENLNPAVRLAVDGLLSRIDEATGFRLPAVTGEAEGKTITLTFDGTPEQYGVSEKNGSLTLTGGCYLSLAEAVKELAALFETTGELKTGYTKTGALKGGVPLTKEGGYTLVWNDEFDGDTLNPYNWMGSDTTVDGHDGGIVVRKMSDENVYVKDGNMVIVGRKLDTPNDYETSPHIKTQKHMTFRYGYLEMYAKLPELNKGIWPALWLNSGGLGYDIAPEIDVFEVFGSKTTLSANVHKWPSSAMQAEGRVHTALDGVVNNRSYVMEKGALSDDYHLYSFEWDENQMIFRFDGKTYYTHTMDDELKKELYVIISMLVGAKEVDPPTSATVFPVYYMVDWVRLYQKEGQIVTFYD